MKTPDHALAEHPRKKTYHEPTLYMLCADCLGRGKKDDGAPCPSCEGWGRVAVREPQGPENLEAGDI